MALIQQSNLNSSSVNHTQSSHHNSSGTVSSHSSWIVHNGATDHICPSKCYFNFLKPITPIQIKLPNHTTVLARFSGSINLGKITLHHVLYVPDFVAHLISIPQLLSQNNCMIIFCDITCFIMQKSTFQMIGLAKKCNGLFYLQDIHDFSDLKPTGSGSVPAVNTSHTANNSPMLWHLRLGHTSNKVLHHLSSIYNDIVFTSFH